MQLKNFANPLELSEVERSPDGLPTAWPILRAGDNVITQRDSMPLDLELSLDDLKAMADYQQAKGAKIPIDCQHVVSNLAGKLGIDEPELLRRLPRYSGVAGFGRLEVRGNALYLADVEFLPIGAEVMKAGQYRYFSPSIRGLDGASPLRVMSVALTNNPCLQHPADLAASEDDMSPEIVRTAQNDILKRKEPAMADPELKPAAQAVPPAAPAVPEGDKHDKIKEIMDVLKEVLGEDVTPENLKVTLAALKTKADGCTDLSEKVKKLECAEAERAKRDEASALEEARAKGFRRGVLTPADLEKPYLKKMTSAELGEYCDSLPDGCRAPVKALELGEHRPVPAQPEAGLSPIQKAIRESTLKAV